MALHFTGIDDRLPIIGVRGSSALDPMECRGRGRSNDFNKGTHHQISTKGDGIRLNPSCRKIIPASKCRNYAFNGCHGLEKKAKSMQVRQEDMPFQNVPHAPIVFAAFEHDLRSAEQHELFIWFWLWGQQDQWDARDRA